LSLRHHSVIVVALGMRRAVALVPIYAEFRQALSIHTKGKAALTRRPLHIENRDAEFLRLVGKIALMLELEKITTPVGTLSSILWEADKLL
jgi:hypothetical protein